MEKCVGSDYMQSKNDSSNTFENSPCKISCSSITTEEKNDRRGCCKSSRVRKKVVEREQRSRERPEEEQRRRNARESRANVLNDHATGSSRQSVQKKTKIIKRNVPDRLGKYVSYSVRSDTKLFSGSEGCKETKLANECLTNNEAVRLSSRQCVSKDRDDIFENIFEGSLGSTRKEREKSSQEAEGRTPEGKKREETAVPPGAPVKDHDGYYSSHKGSRHVCGYCQKIFKSNGKLNSHVYSHTGERPFDCNHCGKAFSSKFKLVRHLLIHSEIRKFVCQICDRTFLRNDHLKNHYKVHDPQKKMYKCSKENCDKEYSSVMSHKKHMAYHNVEDGDLRCLICNVKFETKEEILFHLKSHSGSRLFKSQSDKKFKCEFCERLFLTRKDVTRHLVVHTGERDFLCQFCPQRFGRKDHLVRHIKKSHGNEDLSGRSDVEVKLEIPEPGKKQPSFGEAPATITQPDKAKKTHIVITVQGEKNNSLRRRINETGSKKKSFQKNESVPKKVPFAKGKNSTTQILLQNIPNILIIPNNSIILLRNQGASKKDTETGTNPAPRPEPPRAAEDQNFLSPLPGDPPTSSFAYDPAIFPPPSHFLSPFPESDGFCNFQPELPPFPSLEDADNLNLEMLNHNELLPRPEVNSGSGNGSLLTETSRQIKLLETGMSTVSGEKGGREKGEECEDLFVDGMLSESILDEFKDEGAGEILASDGDVGILGNILSNSSNDNCGFELLRNLLTNENPALSPLPGFSQIFQNSNANSG